MRLQAIWAMEFVKEPRASCQENDSVIVRYRAVTVLTLLAAGITPSHLDASRKTREEAASLLARAQALTDLRAAGNPAFRLRAHVIVWGHGQGLEGEYDLVWAAPERWREEMTLPGYNEVVVADQG